MVLHDIVDPDVPGSANGAEWTFGPQPPRISAAATLASAAVAARRTCRPLFIERTLDIRGDVRASVNHVGLVQNEHQVLFARDVGRGGASLIDQRLEQLVLLVGDELVELGEDLALVGVVLGLRDFGASRVAAASLRIGSSSY